MAKPLNLAKNKSAAGAAKALYGYLIEMLQESGLSEEQAKREVLIRGLNDPDESWARGAWHVIWESGPFEWAVYMLGGSSILRGEYPSAKTPEVVGFSEARGWSAEAGFSFSITFRPD